MACVALLAAACADMPKLPVDTDFQGQPVRTTVDAPEAKYYLETWLQGRRGDAMLDARIAELQVRSDEFASREALQSISQTFSVDFATLHFADQLLKQDCHRDINRRFAAALAADRRAHPAAQRYVVLFVPGWDYLANGQQTGADFREPRRLAAGFGLENHLVPLPPNGGVEENARVVADAVRRQAGQGKEILIAGASSAGPAIHLALGRLLTADERRPVKAWLNLGGILQGSPLVDLALRWPQVWLLNAYMWSKGWDRAAIESMSVERSRARFATLRLDPELLVINYLGVPLSGQVGRFASDKYPLLRALGPNDGLTLLADAIVPDTPVIVAFGSDHFFADDPRINDKTLAMMALVVDALEGVDRPRCGHANIRVPPTAAVYAPVQ
ncbi:MAG: hypothetical protein SF172_00865 [Burkholderiales bacterium]|nr:hypothetical protein [Burkholderiales bacterium]